MRYVYAPIAVIIGSVALSVGLSRHDRNIALVGFYAWQLFHFQKQNVGLASLIASADRVPAPNGFERRAIITLGLLGSLAIIFNPRIVQLLPTWTEPGIISALIDISFAFVALTGLLFWFRRPREQRSVATSLMYMTAVVYVGPVFWFSNPYRCKHASKPATLKP
jgi:hypothetical protein